MKNGKILWADDEIDLLKPHILFLQQKGYEVTTVSNGRDALEKAAHETFDRVAMQRARLQKPELLRQDRHR